MPSPRILDRLSRMPIGPIDKPKRARATFRSSDVVGVGSTFSGPVSRPAAVRPARLAAHVVPQSLAYAGLAGLPPQTGLSCYLLAGLGHALLRSSRLRPPARRPPSHCSRQ